MNRLFGAAGVDSDSALARVLGIQPPSVAGARKRGLIPGGWIEKIALDYNVTADWLLFGRGPMHPSESTEQSPPLSIQRFRLPRNPCHRWLAHVAPSWRPNWILSARNGAILLRKTASSGKKTQNCASAWPVMKNAPLNRTWKNLIRVIALLLERKK